MTPVVLVAAIVALAFGLAAFDAWAQVVRTSDHGPFDPALLATYAWVIGVSMLGGIASFYGKVKSGHARWVNLGEFLGELVTSAIAGLITYWFCRAAGVNEWWMAAFVAIAGHMGTRALFMLEKVLERWAARFGVTSGPPLDPGTSTGPREGR